MLCMLEHKAGVAVFQLAGHTAAEDYAAGRHGRRAARPQRPLHHRQAIKLGLVADDGSCQA